ncbi:MAG: SPASM domain-containing protein [Defluviitaleaceae bacterium]|nr:SPASM domain-containing protein [Defluviitaleaceae bacterium]
MRKFQHFWHETDIDYINIGKTKLEHIDIENAANLNNEQKQLLTDLKSKESLVKKRLKICPEVFGKLSVDWDGQVTACCADYDGNMIIGDINKNTIAEIFHSDIAENYRQILRKREFTKIRQCNSCYDYMNLQGS